MLLKQTAGVVVALIGILVGYALLEDAFYGLSFTRAARSWSWWALGLFLLGLAAVVMEGTFEWVFAPREYGHPMPRRVLRIIAGVLILIVLAVTAIALGPHFMRPDR